VSHRPRAFTGFDTNVTLQEIF